MKQISSLLIFFAISHLAIFSQNVGIGTLTPGKKLDVVGSTNVSDTIFVNRIKINGGAPGVGKVLTSDEFGLASWQQTNTQTFEIGDFAFGGVVFWVNASGTHGKVVSVYNINSLTWCNQINQLVGPSAQSNLNGAGNTVAIIQQPNHISSAAEICADLAFSGCDDWYLPSKNELNLIYQNLSLINQIAVDNGGESFSSTTYWSSTENNSTTAWAQDFTNGNQTTSNKINSHAVRAIKAF